MASSPFTEHNRPTDPVTLTTGRLLLRAVGPRDTEAVYAACQDPGIQRWTTVPSPYLREHARDFTGRIVPDGWADGSLFTFGAFLPSGDLAAVVGLSRHAPDVGEIGFWCVREHRGHGHVTEAVLAVCRWAFVRLGTDRVEWRAEVGNTASRAVARRAGFTLEGTLRSAVENKGVRRDCWVGSLLPSDLDLPPAVRCSPARPWFSRFWRFGRFSRFSRRAPGAGPSERAAAVSATPYRAKA